MTSRTTADIEANMRELAAIDPVKMYREWEIEAADRLAELNASVQSYSDELFAILDQRPPCPACGGRRNLGAGTRHDDYESDWSGCPDCIDGKMSVERMAAIVAKVWSADMPIIVGDPWAQRAIGWNDALVALRAEMEPTR